MSLLGPASSGSNLQKHSQRGFSDARVNITRNIIPIPIPEKKRLDGNYSS